VTGWNEIEKLSWRELQALFAANFVTELAERERGGSGEAVLHERLTRLSVSERRVLREAFDAVG
jgi:hypothetical protein